MISDMDEWPMGNPTVWRQSLGPDTTTDLPGVDIPMAIGVLRSLRGHT